jgi:hypothetical protein
VGEFDKLKQQVNFMVVRENRNRCADANRRLGNAQKRLVSPGYDPTVELEIIMGVRSEIELIPMCVER